LEILVIFLRFLKVESVSESAQDMTYIAAYHTSAAISDFEGIHG